MNSCFCEAQKWSTHWGRDELDATFQTTFSKAFFLMKMFQLPLKFHWSLFPRVQLTLFQHWFRWWLGAIQVTSHYLNQWWLVTTHICITRPQWVNEACHSTAITRATILISCHIVDKLRPGQDGRHFGRQHFQRQICQWKCFHFDNDFTELCSQGSN